MYLSHFVVRTSDTIGDSELMKFVMFETPPRKETEDKPSHSSNDTEYETMCDMSAVFHLPPRFETLPLVTLIPNERESGAR